MRSRLVPLAGRPTDHPLLPDRVIVLSQLGHDLDHRVLLSRHQFLPILLGRDSSRGGVR